MADYRLGPEGWRSPNGIPDLQPQVKPHIETALVENYEIQRNKDKWLALGVGGTALALLGGFALYVTFIRPNPTISNAEVHALQAAKIVFASDGRTAADEAQTPLPTGYSWVSATDKARQAIGKRADDLMRSSGQWSFWQAVDAKGNVLDLTRAQ